MNRLLVALVPLTLVACVPGPGASQEPSPSRRSPQQAGREVRDQPKYMTATFRSLIVKDAEKDFDLPPEKGPELTSFAELHSLSRKIEALNQLGKEGWEVIAVGERGLVLRKSAAGQQWEYKVSRSPECTLNGRSTDDDNLLLILDALDRQGWQVCFLSPVMVLKRSVTVLE